MTTPAEPQRANCQFMLEIPIEMDTSDNAQEVIDKVTDSLSFLLSLEYLRGLRLRQATLTERF